MNDAFRRVAISDLLYSSAGCWVNSPDEFVESWLSYCTISAGTSGGRPPMPGHHQLRDQRGGVGARDTVGGPGIRSATVGCNCFGADESGALRSVPWNATL